ncbi:MAG: hypothetical protein A3A16_02105 [Candidatus Harrisonbacteria bacterium RIFCSPLOWO2_01_FULL_44_18]|uniref:Uncharacterized protein n=1 Tax=Candidatus Harrisonbacteria bacterium RIFCSPLOWO2_01_FULL_44_18 TaxID=1798407 RepID=A0A1G1ZPU2_9BACT|nr:MAG: hypothetical protein A3A16_02105 [Candidatus Harrisonbacteria bacterium RIFCSPLOWO2_01_FULL_44_18]
MAEPARPLIPWDSEDANHPKLIWRNKIDKRFLIEVRRAGNYSAKLFIFDHQKNDRPIACWRVSLAYGAMFGPEVADVNEWQEKVVNFIDKAYLKRKKNGKIGNNLPRFTLA